MKKEEYNKYMREYYAKNRAKLVVYHYMRNKEKRETFRDKYNQYMKDYRKRQSVDKQPTTNN